MGFLLGWSIYGFFWFCGGGVLLGEIEFREIIDVVF